MKLQRRTAHDPKRSERGATDPVLVIAAVAVSLVLLVGGGYAINGLVTDGQNLNAREDLARVATAEDSVKASTGTYWRYDSHGESTFRELESPARAGSEGVGFTPTDGGRLVVDVEGDAWVAASLSASGDIWVRTSESATALRSESTTLGAAAARGGMYLTVRAPGELAVPDGFESDWVERIIDAVDSGAAYDFTRGGTATPDAPGSKPEAPPVTEPEDEPTAPPAPAQTVPKITTLLSGATFSREGAAAFSIDWTGTPRPTIAIARGTLPPGLSIDLATGEISGVPTELGSWQVTVDATNPVGTDRRFFSFSVRDAPTFLDGEPPVMVVGTQTAWPIPLIGSPAPTVGRTDGTLPPGVSVNSSQRRLQGAPTTAGTYTFTLRSVNPAGDATVTYTIEVLGPPTFTAPGATQSLVGWRTTITDREFLPAMSGGTAPITFSSDNLPPGIQIDAATGRIFGQPARAGVFPFTVTATNPWGSSVKSYSMRVS